MAIRVLPRIDPRLVIVSAPDIEMTQQNLTNEVMDWEHFPSNLTYERIIVPSGKQILPDGVTRVAITNTLENAQIAFEQRTTSSSNGAVTTGDADGKILIDSSATFISDGVQPGATIINLTDESAATVLSVDSETQLTLLFQLDDGSDNQFEVGDSYKVWNTIQCELSGGNMVSVDNAGDPIGAIFPTAFTQIIRTSSSSATLQELAAIQYSSFDGGVTVDITSSYSGTDYPVGTKQQPVNNLDDAKSIAVNRGFSKFFVVDDISIDAGNYPNFIFIGESIARTNITIGPSANVESCEFLDATVAGTLDGNTTIKNCRVLDLDYIYGIVESSMIGPGTITLGGVNEAHFLDCWSGVAGTGAPTINCGGSGQSLAIRNYNGGVIITNQTGSDDVSIELNSGQVTLDNTVTDGNFVVRGIGFLYDNSTGATVNSDALINSDKISNAVWDENIVNHVTPNTTGYEAMLDAYGDYVYIEQGAGSGTNYPWGTPGSPVGNVADAIVIANLFGIGAIHISGTITISGGEDLSNFTLKADRSFGNRVDVVNAVTNPTYFTDLTVGGTMNGGVRFTTSVLLAIDGFDGGAKNCLITDAINIVGNGANYFTDCDTYITDGSAYKTLNIGDKLVNLIRCEGNYEIDGKTSTGTTIVNMVGGKVRVTSSCVSGDIEINGLASVDDQSSAGCIVRVDDAVSAGAMWDVTLSSNPAEGTPAEALSIIRKIETGNWKIEDNQMIFYDTDGVTPVLTFNLFDENGVPTMENPFERVAV